MHKLLRILKARIPLFASTLFGVLIGLALNSFDPTTRALIGWNAAIILYFGWVTSLMCQATRATLMQRAQSHDEGSAAILTLAIIAALACIVAIGGELNLAKNVPGQAWHTALAGVTIVSAWAFIHFIFAIHYAHHYYMPGAKGGVRGGLDFAGTAQPTYGDFVYFSYIIGTSAQTADVAIASPALRRLNLVQAVLAFFFNTTLLALSINLAAGLI